MEDETESIITLFYKFLVYLHLSTVCSAHPLLSKRELRKKDEVQRRAARKIKSRVGLLVRRVQTGQRQFAWKGKGKLRWYINHQQKEGRELSITSPHSVKSESRRSFFRGVYSAMKLRPMGHSEHHGIKLN